ncbi:hypothetical protein FPZ43_14400 [Mucilaginibacter pallidiroseus]|uniref:2-iminobutanoate/2-iminopropanoate deaminase n=1 Tax=Mucilaginibacter pallidiroseus TaxID=2599295 RepID=A0A563U4V1_9SPHI|nr:Rid family hydrolase [Mucilaginibacter pallidiroseus]TWR26353.1 hypothetical protein FPZ43_14400 [Mucilaginibacter pallidiroseus]
MVAKIESGKSLNGALYYNENKVKSGKAQLLATNGYTKSDRLLSFDDKLFRLTDLAGRNIRTKTSTLHLSLNFDVNETIDEGKLIASWEDEYGYVQAVKNGNMVYVSGQLGHDEKGTLAEGMEKQMSLAYTNIKNLLNGFGYLEDDIMEEVIYVTEMQAGFQTRKTIGAKFYPDPKRIASSIIGVSELAIPGQVVEIKVVAMK